MNADEKWQALLSAGRPAFAGDAEAPYGFVTRTMARMREERREREQLDRISLRALWASLAALALVATITLGLEMRHGNDIDSGVKTLVHVGDSELF